MAEGRRGRWFWALGATAKSDFILSEGKATKKLECGEEPWPGRRLSVVIPSAVLRKGCRGRDRRPGGHPPLSERPMVGSKWEQWTC